jgi:hypothetical protein
VLTQTLVVDAEGVYDPRLLNDRLLLGLKGTMSEFELGLLHQRAQEAYRQKVLRGEVLTQVPTGYVRQGPASIEMIADRQIQEALRGVFFQFERLGTLRQVLLWYHQEKLPLPVMHQGAPEVEWKLPNYEYLLRLLRNPTYAGAFAYGRTRCRSHVVEGRSRKSGGHRVAMDQWQVLLKDHHAAYISWDQYMEHQRILRTVIHEIVTDVNHTTGQIELRIHWAGGVHTLLQVHKNQVGRNTQATEKNVVELVRELAQVQPDGYIAATLNRLGYHTGPGNSWNETRVKNLRLYNQIPVFQAGARRPWLTMVEAAEELEVEVDVIRTMIKYRLSAARQIVKHAPWMIQREDLQRSEVQSYAKAARAGKPAPRGDNKQTLMPYL